MTIPITGVLDQPCGSVDNDEVTCLRRVTSLMETMRFYESTAYTPLT